MNSPHGSSRIMALSFLKETEDTISSALLSSSSSPSSYQEDRHVICATSSDDGTVKVWMASKQASTAINISAMTLSKNTTTTSTTTTAASSSTSHDHNTDALQWTCSYSFQYRNITANCLSFSKDGSSMAVSHGGLLTLWDPTRYRLIFELIMLSFHHLSFGL